MKIAYIRLLFDYPCYPVWLYDEDGCCIDTSLPPEWQDDSQLDALFSQLQDSYNALFLDNSHEFRYIGFQSKAEHLALHRMVATAVEALYKKNNGKYRIINDLEI